MDEETVLYYYGARYLDPKYSRWLSGDPALGDYIHKAPIDDEAKKHNENLPGMGGVFNVVNLHLYHYAGIGQRSDSELQANNPVKYTDPDGRICEVFTLNNIAHENLIRQLSDIKNRVDKINDYSTLMAWFSMIPSNASPFLGGGATLISSSTGLVGSMPNEFISIYYETLVSALKNYSDGKSFDKNCALELNFATVEKYAGKQDDFATVWATLLKNPNAKTKDLPDKMSTEYFVTLRWKDENGKTLGGKMLQLSNKAEFDALRNMVIAAGGKNEE